MDGTVDPVRDIETISLELVFADADQCTKRLKKVEREVVGQAGWPLGSKGQQMRQVRQGSASKAG